MSDVRVAWFNGLNTSNPSDWSAGALGVLLGDNERAELRRASGLRHAKIYGSSAALAALAARAARDALKDTSPERCGLIVAGLGHHLAPAWRFAKEAYTHGARLVTPMSFPGILPSAAPSAIAAAVEAKAFAFAVGTDQGAFIEGIRRAERCIYAGWCDAAIVTSACAADPLIIEALKRAGAVRTPADASIAAVVWDNSAANCNVNSKTKTSPFRSPDTSIFCDYYRPVSFFDETITKDHEYIFCTSAIIIVEQIRKRSKLDLEFHTNHKSQRISIASECS